MKLLTLFCYLANDVDTTHNDLVNVAVLEKMCVVHESVFDTGPDLAAM